jgi:uncharacterized protein YjbI with pentapeptide repeats
VIHDRLPENGFAGCTVYDCFGAGQQVVQVTFAGRRWRDDAALAVRMFAAFEVTRGVHEILVYLRDALARRAATSVYPELEALQGQVMAVRAADESVVMATDVNRLRAQIGPVLHRVSRLVRSDWLGPDLAGADPACLDLVGVDRAGANLRGGGLAGACLRGAVLIGADLRNADLRCADLLGADLRGARLEGADLDQALFLTITQVNSARGDGRTRLPVTVRRPERLAW